MYRWRAERRHPQAWVMKDGPRLRPQSRHTSGFAEFPAGRATRYSTARTCALPKGPEQASVSHPQQELNFTQQRTSCQSNFAVLIRSTERRQQHFPSLSSETDTGCCYPARCPHHREDNNRPKLPLANKTREQPKSTPAHKLPASLPDISG